MNIEITQLYDVHGLRQFPVQIIHMYDADNHADNLLFP